MSTSPSMYATSKACNVEMPKNALRDSIRGARQTCQLGELLQVQGV
jgi:hypothetical protein